MSDVGQLLSFVIPVALGSAISPLLLVTQVGILSQNDRPRPKAMAFLAGAVAALCVWALIVSTALMALVNKVEELAIHEIGVLDRILGIVLLLVAGYLILVPERQKDSDGSNDHSEVATAASSGGLVKSLSFGFVMQVRDISSIVLFISAIQHIDTSTVPALVKWLIGVGLICITTVTMWVPLFVKVRIPTAFLQRIKPAAEWARQHLRQISIGVCLVFGCYLIIRGFF